MKNLENLLVAVMLILSILFACMGFYTTGDLTGAAFFSSGVWFGSAMACFVFINQKK